MDSPVVHWTIKPGVTMVAETETETYLTWLGQRYFLKGVNPKLAKKFLTKLEVPTELAELIDHFCGVWEPDIVRWLLTKLIDSHLVVASTSADASLTREAPTLDDSEWSGFFNRLSVSSSQRAQGFKQFKSLKVKLITSFDLNAGFLSDLNVERISRYAFLSENDFQHTFDRQLLILLLPANDYRMLELMGRTAWESGQLVFPILVDTDGFILGPFCNRPGLPCLECLSKRFRANRAGASIEVSPERLAEVQNAWPRIYWQILDSVVKQEIFKWSTKICLSPLLRGSLTFDLFNHRTAEESVYPIPGCYCSRGLATGKEFDASV